MLGRSCNFDTRLTMHIRLMIAALLTFVVGPLFMVQIQAETLGTDDVKLDALIADGDLTAAEKLLRARVGSSDGPVTEPAAIRLEVLRRTRQDFAITNDQVLEEIKKSIPDATQE